MKRKSFPWVLLRAALPVVLAFGVFAAESALSPQQLEAQAEAAMLVALKELKAASKPFIDQLDLVGLERIARQYQSGWAVREARGYGTLMYNAAYAFENFPIQSAASKTLAIEFRELSIHRTAETEILEELRDLPRGSQAFNLMATVLPNELPANVPATVWKRAVSYWDLVATILPNELEAMRERYAGRMLTAWQRAEDAWDQIRERPLITPVATNNLIRFVPLVPGGATTQPDEMPMPDSYYRFLKEQGLGTGPEVAREYNFRIGLQNELPNYTNAAPKNLASAFAQPPQDFGRLAALTEQHLKKPESRDAFYGVAVRGVPENLRPQFLAVVRETQERRKAHAQSPGAPMVREHPKQPRAGTIPQGSNSVSAKPAGKPIPAVAPPIVGTVSPETSAGEPVRRTSAGYLPLVAVFAAGVVLWWFLTRSRPR